jgi:two-component system sensor histidine kinase UhpB
LPAISLPARARHNLFLTLKEALRNVARHAAAKNVRVALSLTDHSLRLVIEDDGGGIAGSLASSANPSPVKVNGLGNGLANMRARAQELGAELVIEPCSPQGTRVAVTMPLPSGELLSVNTR